jgi:hypothetical protein
MNFCVGFFSRFLAEQQFAKINDANSATNLFFALVEGFFDMNFSCSKQGLKQNSKSVLMHSICLEAVNLTVIVA